MGRPGSRYPFPGGRRFRWAGRDPGFPISVGQPGSRPPVPGVTGAADFGGPARLFPIPEKLVIGVFPGATPTSDTLYGLLRFLSVVLWCFWEIAKNATPRAGLTLKTFPALYKMFASVGAGGQRV